MNLLGRGSRRRPGGRRKVEGRGVEDHEGVDRARDARAVRGEVLAVCMW